MYEEAAMKARPEKLRRENIRSNEARPGLEATVASLFKDSVAPARLGEARVSCSTRLRARAERPMAARTRKTPRQEVKRRRRAPSTGADMGDMRTMDWTRARIFSRWLQA